MPDSVGQTLLERLPDVVVDGFSTPEGTHRRPYLNQKLRLPGFEPTISGIKLVVRPVTGNASDLLAGREQCDLVIKGPTGNVLANWAAPGRWTHDALGSRLNQDDAVRLVDGDCADAFLGTEWIGSTEV